MALLRERGARTGQVQGSPVALNGANMVAQAMRQMDPDVVACYPITPQTILTEAFSEFVANGEVHTEFLPVESEHAAMSACIGAAAAGGRAQTATSGPGLALMWEVLWVASGMRLPIVMHLCTRAFNSPLNILGDHSDMMGMRDTGWVILSAEDGQEAYDTAIQAVRIAEHPDVLLPVASAMDGFTITHGVERAELLPDEVVKEFVGQYKPKHYLLDTEHPVTMGPNDYRDYYFEHKRQQVDAMEKAQGVVTAIAKEYGDMVGRYHGLFDTHRLEDAEVAIVVMGSVAGTVRTVVDELRENGVKAGVLRLRLFRPFPAAALAQALSHVKALAVLDRAISSGGYGNALFMEVCSALFNHGIYPKVLDYVYGLGGRDTLPVQFRSVYDDLKRMAGTGKVEGPPVRYLGVRDKKGDPWR